jgi:signal transduction histidine kinase
VPPSLVPSSNGGGGGARRRWGRPHSIRARLHAVFAILLLLVAGLGAFSIARLADVNRESEIIRNHWLQATRTLGDISNYMSDYRTAEASLLLSSTPLERAGGEKEIAALQGIVARSQRAYEAVPHETSEITLYAQFASQWHAYQGVAAQVLALAHSGDASAAVALYMTDSRRAFELSSDTLGQLTDETVSKARDASARAAATYQRARTLIIAAMLTAIWLLLAAILYITRSILNPLLALAARMRALAHHDTNIAIPCTGRPDEMGEMARSVAVFRENALALMSSQRRLIEQAATLEEALEKEQRLTDQQRNFVSMTSHEFRTPLTIIDGHAQRLIKLSDRLDPTEIAERGARVRSAVQRMTNIMDSLLGATRLLDGQAVYHPVELDPATVLREACQAHREATRGVNLREDIEDSAALLTGDPKLLFHAFSNLISNAIKYSPPTSPIDVVARHESGHLVVQIRDHGIGIPARDRERLFTRYFRGGNATGIAGTGVGLHLVAMVVALHQGEVIAESLEGVGSTFIVRLPEAASALSAQMNAALDVA